MNNILIHGPDGDEFNSDVYAYDAKSNKFTFHNLIRATWLVFDDVDITIDVTGFLIEITCTYRHNLNFS